MTRQEIDEAIERFEGPTQFYLTRFDTSPVSWWEPGQWWFVDRKRYSFINARELYNEG